MADRQPKPDFEISLIPAFSPEEKEKRLPPFSRTMPLDGSDWRTNDQKMCQGIILSPRERKQVRASVSLIPFAV